MPRAGSMPGFPIVGSAVDHFRDWPCLTGPHRATTSPQRVLPGGWPARGLRAARELPPGVGSRAARRRPRSAPGRASPGGRRAGASRSESFPRRLWPRGRGAATSSWRVRAVRARRFDVRGRLVRSGRGQLRPAVRSRQHLQRCRDAINPFGTIRCPADTTPKASTMDSALGRWAAVLPHNDHRTCSSECGARPKRPPPHSIPRSRRTPFLDVMHGRIPRNRSRNATSRTCPDAPVWMGHRPSAHRRHPMPAPAKSPPNKSPVEQAWPRPHTRG